MKTLHFLVRRGTRDWVAQCIEHDIVAQAKSLKGMPEAIVRRIIAETALYLKFDRTLDDISPPPAIFKLWYNDSVRLSGVKVSEDTEAELAISPAWSRS